jgi:hypothetical protein
MKAFSLRALMAVIEFHKLEPVNGEYKFTAEMLEEAADLDEAHLTAERYAALKALVEDKEKGKSG